MSKSIASPRTRYLVAAAALTIGLLPALAGATVLMEDKFRYPDGPLVGQGGWAAHSGAGARPIQVATDQIRVEQAAGSGEDVNKRWFTAQSATAKTYAKFNLRVPSAGAGAADEYFAHFRPFPDTLNFRARIYTGFHQAGGCSLGISATSSATSPVVHWPALIQYDRNYSVVSCYDAATGTATLWVDPVSEGSPSVSSTHATAVGNQVESYAFRQSNLNTSSQIIMDVVVTTVFTEAAQAKVPSLGEWGMIVLGLVLVLGGTLFVVRRRAASA